MAGMGEGGVLPMLSSPLNEMSQSDLRTVIPQIIRSTTGVRPQYGNQLMKPEWWPYDLPYCNPRDDFRDPVLRKTSWNMVLRDIVQSCYQYYDQQHLLDGNGANKENPIKVINNQDGSVSFLSHSAVTLEDRQNTPYASCPPTLEAATPGQMQCASTGSIEPTPTGLYQAASNKRTNAKASSTAVSGRSSTKRFFEVFMCFFCEEEFNNKPQLQQHQKECPLWLKNFSRSVSGMRTRSQPEVVKVVPRKPRKLVEDKVVFPSKGSYIESLGLLPQAKAETVRRQSCSKTVDCDVIEIDESKPPKTPTTPRTPKSLISQLSRDMSPPAHVRRRTFESSLEESDDTVNNTEEDTSDDDIENKTGYRPRRAASLLTIDVSSLLGARVMNHITTYFANLETVETSPDSSNRNYENFCRTPTKDKVIERLRSRGKENFQVTFKPTRRIAPAHSHHYKFRRTELKEFCRTVETGLNKRSRVLKRQAKRCKVVLNCLSSEEIKKWTQRRKPSTTVPTRQHGQYINTGVYSKQNTLPNMGFTASERLRHLLTSVNTTGSQAVKTTVKDYMQQQQQQQALLFTNLLTANMQNAMVPNSPADLTPPSTPEDNTCVVVDDDDDDVICLDDSNPSEQPSSTQPSPISGGYARNDGYNNIGRKHNLTADEASQDDDDVISISSSEDNSDLKVISPASQKRANPHSHAESDIPAKRRRINQLRPSALLFKCHLCFEEITCRDNANYYIKGHFASKHNVYNIDLIEHVDASGQSVVSIVEVPSEQRQPPQSSFYLTAPESAQPLKPARHKPAILQSRRDSKTPTPPPRTTTASLPSKNKPATKAQVKTTKTVAKSKAKPTSKPVVNPLKNRSGLRVALKMKGTNAKPQGKQIANKENGKNAKTRKTAK